MTAPILQPYDTLRPNDPIWVQLTDYDDVKYYAWYEVYQVPISIIATGGNWVDGTATISTNDNDLAVGDIVSLTGFFPNEYNGTFEVVTATATDFTFDLPYASGSVVLPGTVSTTSYVEKPGGKFGSLTVNPCFAVNGSPLQVDAVYQAWWSHQDPGMDAVWAIDDTPLDGVTDCYCLDFCGTQMYMRVRNGLIESVTDLPCEGSGSGSPPTCCPTVCVNIASLENQTTESCNCESLIGYQILNLVYDDLAVTCTWSADITTKGTDCEYKFTVTRTDTTVTFTVSHLWLGSTVTDAVYSLTTANWDCGTEITLNLVTDSEALGGCANWPATVTVGPCPGSGSGCVLGDCYSVTFPGVDDVEFSPGVYPCPGSPTECSIVFQSIWSLQYYVTPPAWAISSGSGWYGASDFCSGTDNAVVEFTVNENSCVPEFLAVYVDDTLYAIYQYTGTASWNGTDDLTMVLVTSPIVPCANFPASITISPCGGSGSGTCAMVARYIANEGSGTTLADSSGQGNDLTTGSATWSADTPGTIAGGGGSVEFTNGSDTWDALTANGLPMGNDARTMMFWAKFSDANTANVAVLNYGLTPYSKQILQYNGVDTILFQDGTVSATAAGDERGTVNTWHHYAITYDAGVLLFYRDGVLEATGVIASLATSGVFTELYGSAAVGQNVWMKDARIYDCALTADQISAIYGGGGSGSGGTFDQTYTSDTTIVIPYTGNYRLRVWGGGGGAGGGFSGTTLGGSGGGGGGFAESVVSLVSGDVISVAIGTGGFGGTAGNPGSGGFGSSISSVSGTGFTGPSATGGNGGQPAGGSAGTGGTGTGDTVYDGGDGAIGALTYGGGGGSGANSGSNGTNGSGQTGGIAATDGGNGGDGGTGSGAGSKGALPGGGGGGGGEDDGSGGDGSDGQARVTLL